MKTVVPSRVPWVRIPPSPPFIEIIMRTTAEITDRIHSYVSPRKVISSGLVCVALLASGCGMSKEERNRRIEAKEVKTEQVLKTSLYPAMAILGKKASRFAKHHKDSAIWYEINRGQKELSIYSENNKHTLDITLKKGVGGTNFQPGDVETVVIENPLTSVRVETDEDEKPCSKGITASTEHFTNSGEEDTLSRFVTIDRCVTWSVGMGINDLTPTDVIADKIIVDMNTNLQKVMHEVKSD